MALTYGMVGGGPGAFIGDVHRKAINFDGLARLEAGCFSSSYDNTLATGAELGLPRERLYESFEQMAEKEALQPEKIDFVVIVTPNHTHYSIAKAFLKQKIHVVCDKPLTLETAEAEELKSIAADNGCLFTVTYTYTGYPAVKQARELITRGEIGDIRFVNAEYAQEWLATPLEKEGHKQASWRMDPARTGVANSVGDIGSHVENIVSYVTGLKIKELCARLDIFGEGRPLDDNAGVMVNYTNGARGLYWVSQIAIGSDNGLKFRVFGTKGSIEWRQEDPNYLIVSRTGKPKEIISRGRDDFFPPAQAYSRVPAGHPEGYFEAFANIYRTFCGALMKLKAGEPVNPDDYDFPKIEDGIAGVKFIHKCVDSSKQGAVWIDY